MTEGRQPAPGAGDPRRKAPRAGQPSKKAGPPAGKKRPKYPVAKPFAPPPQPVYRAARVAPPAGYQPPPPSPVTYRPPSYRPRRPSSSGRPLAALLVVSVAFVCLAVGWFIVNGLRSQSEPSAPMMVAKANLPAVPAPGEKDNHKPPPSAPTDKAKGEGVARAAGNSADGANVRLTPAPPEKAPAPPSLPVLTPPPMPQAQAAGVTFEQHVLPIFQAKCVNCHGAIKQKADLDVRTLAALRKGGDSGPSVVAGSLERSPLWESIVSNRMPPNRNKLTEAEKKVLQEWIVSGARSASALTAGAAPP